MCETGFTVWEGTEHWADKDLRQAWRHNARKDTLEIEGELRRLRRDDATAQNWIFVLDAPDFSIRICLFEIVLREHRSTQHICSCILKQSIILWRSKPYSISNSPGNPF